jgi:hypothetical protein
LTVSPKNPTTRSPVRRVLTWLIFVGAVLALLTTPASAAVNLLYFQGQTESDRIFLEWETATELDNAGFLVGRNQIGGNDTSFYTPVPVIDATSGVPYTFIPARGDSLLGAYYPFYDENVAIGTRYYYLLQDVDTSNFSSYHGPIEVVAGQTNTPTPTPSSTSPPSSPTRTPTSSPSPAGPSATPSATRTATPISRTATPTVAFSATATSSLTPAGTQDPDVTPLDATLTAIARALTELPTATRTPVPLAQAQTPTPTDLVALNTAPSPDADSGLLPAAGSGQIGRLVLVILLFIGSGGLLTGGVIFLASRSREEA